MRHRALFVTHEYPWPTDAGWKLRAFQSLSAVSSKFDVYLVALTEGEVAYVDQQALQEHCLGVKAVTLVQHSIRIRRNPFKLATALAKAFSEGAPYSMSKFHRWSIVTAIRTAIIDFRPDLIYVGNLHLLQATKDAVEFNVAAPLILEVQNVEHLMWEDFVYLLPWLQRLLARREARLLRAYESKAWAFANGVVAIAPEDAAIIARNAPGTVVKHIAPSLKWQDKCSSVRKRPVTVGLIGNWSWPPNQFSLDWFISEIVPRLEAYGGRPHIQIAGAGLTREMAERAKKRGCEVLGYVSSASDFYAGVDILAAPDIVGGVCG